MQTFTKEWITTKELAKLKGISERAIRKAISNHKYVFRKCSKSYEILVTSIEENVKEKITQQEEKFLPASEIHNTVPEEQKKLALAKYDLIKQWNEYRDKKKNKTISGKEFIDSYNEKFICLELFDVIGKVAIGTIYEWDKRLRINHNDWHCLINNYTFGYKTQRTALSTLEEELFLKVLLHPNQINIGKAIKITKTTLKQRGLNKFCCDMTYRRFADKYKKEHYDTWVLAREGSKALNDKVIPYISRDISKLEVGDVIIGDGHKLAFFVINPYTGKETRATMVAYQDWKSAALVGFEIMIEENTQCIASALRNAIITLGKVPKYVYHDNGKAFRAKYFVESGLSGLFTNLGIQPVFAKPYNAKAKPIERFFREFQDSFEVLLPSYTGTSIAKKPARLKRNEKLHKSLSNDFVPTIEQVISAIKQWLNYHYAEPCPNVKGKTIGEVLESGKGTGVNIEKLDDLMMAREIKTIGRNGIKFMKNDYYDTALYGYRGNVIIKYSLFDLSFIKVYKTNGEFICIANRVESIHPLANYFGDVKDIEDLKQRTKLKKKLEQRTELEYIRQLNRDEVCLPLLSADLAEKQEYDDLTDFNVDKKEDCQEKYTNGCFIDNYERYEYLLNKDSLTNDEKIWLKNYEETDEYKLIYCNYTKEVINE